jgi:RND family efflux transporter MFP subunit
MSKSTCLLSVWRGPALAGVILASSLSSGCGRSTPPPPAPRVVRTMVVNEAPDGASATYTAEIRSRYESDLSFQISGKLISRTVDVGTAVRKGAVLAQIDQADQRVSVEASRAAVNAARAEVDRARSDEARYRDLLERGLTTRATYLAQQTAAKTGQSKLEQAMADLKLNEQRLGYTSLRAPDDGIVTGVMAEVGAVVSAGQRIISIARPGELEAVFDVPDSRIDEVRAAGTVQVALLTSPESAFSARVREVSPSADPITRTYRVKTAIANPPPNLRLGMSVTAMMPQESARSAIVLPATALFQQGRQPAAWVVAGNQTLELRPVEIQRYDSDRVFISKGLRVGERVVTAGVHRLAAGEHVRPLVGAPPVGASQ